MVKIAVVGSLNMDVVIPVNQYPQDGETVFTGSLRYTPGGKGANQAVAAARLGAEVRMIGKVGSDAHGQQLIHALNQEGINTEGVRISSQDPTGQAFVHVESDGNNRIMVSQGANSTLTEQDINENIHLFDEIDAILVQLEVPIQVVQYVIRKAKSKQISVFLDPAPYVKEGEKLVKEADYIFPNEKEAGKLIGYHINHLNAAKDVALELEKESGSKVILTMGSRGTLYTDGHNIVHIPAYKIQAIDSTAAGDAFAAAFVKHYMETEDIEETLKFASANGAITASRWGAYPSLPNMKELKQFLINQHSDTANA